MRQIILDTETTGLYVEQGHRIIEIGCVEMVNRKLTGKHYHQYINPERDIDAGALAVHNITAEFLLDKPIFSTVADTLMAFIGDAELIIHNAPFDVGFINAELALLKGTWKALNHYCRVVDSLAMARQLHIGQRNSLDALCKRYNIDNSHREHHGALLDAHLLARVFLAMTGGQATFFGEHESVEEQGKHFANIATQSARQFNLPVLSATAEELVAHETRLKQLAEKGACLWLEETVIPA